MLDFNLFGIYEFPAVCLSTPCFIKYGTKKLKWTVILPYIIASYVISFLLSMVVIFDRSEIIVCNGVCISDLTSLIFRAALSVLLFLVVILLCVTIVFSCLTYCYAKKNVLKENVGQWQEIFSTSPSLLFLL